MPAMPVKSQWIQNVFHVDLSEAHPGETYYLQANGNSYPLREHSAQSRAQARAAAPTLAAIPDEHLTHYAPGPVLLPHDQVVRVHLKHTLDTFGLPSDTGPRGSFHAYVVVPPATSIQPPPGGNPAPPVHHHINWTSTAQALIFHHPDLITHDPATAAIIFDYMNNSQTSKAIVQQINTLATAMAQMGPPTPVGAQQAGWATLTPVDVTDSKSGKTTTYYRQDPNAAIRTAAGDVMTAMMIATKNDLRLKNKKWVQQQGTAVTSTTESSGSDGGSGGGGDSEAHLLAEVRQGGSGSTWTAELAIQGEQHGIETSLTVTDASTMTFNLNMKNHYLRWVGVYISFYDANDNQIDISDWQSGLDLSPFTPHENEYYRFIGYMEPQNAFLGIPIHGDPGLLSNGSNTEGDGEGITLSFPSGQAVSAKVFACGLGTGSYPYGDAIVFGGVLTGICNFGIPSLMIGFAVAAQTYKPLYKILQTPELLRVAAMAGAAVFAGMFGSSAAHHRMNWHALSVLGQIVFLTGMTPVLQWIQKTVLEQEVADEIPFVGWVATAISISSDLAQMAETIVDITMSPWFVTNKITSTITSGLEVHPDPRHQTWPRATQSSTRKCITKLIYRSQQRPTVSKTFDVATDFSDSVIPFEFAGNTLGGQIKVEADFYVDGWLAGKAQSGWVDNNEQDAASLVLYLVELPVPITATSLFQHSAILSYDAGSGSYQWKETETVPTGTMASLSTATGGNQISECVGLALSQRYAAIAGSYKAAGTGLAPTTGGGTDTQLFAMQSVDIPGMPMTNVKFVTAGFVEQSKLLYDPFPPKFEMKGGNWVLSNGRPVPDPNAPDLGCYYVDPTKASQSLTGGGGYHLRKITPTGSSDFDTNPSTPPLSYGRFPYFPDHLAFHPSGHMVGVSQRHGKIMILAIEPTGQTDAEVPVARTNAGKALVSDRQGLLFRPIAVACSYDGTILVLDQVFSATESHSRIQAFDLLGRPVLGFQDSAGEATAMLPLPNSVEVSGTSSSAVYLDLVATGNRHMTDLFVLYYTGSGDQVSDYNVAVYKYGDDMTTADMTPVVTTNGVPAARIAVDMWHTLYTQNFQMVEDGSGNPARPSSPATGPAGRTVTSISEWLLPVP